MAAQTLGSMGWYSYLAGEHEQSLRYLQRALAILDEIGCPEAFLHDTLGYTGQALDLDKTVRALLDELDDNAD